jgi:soluble lytic murein transglycosylase
MIARSAVLAMAFLAGALVARAEETLPRGLTRSGDVIMMQPIENGENSTVPSNSEHRAGTIHILSAGDRDLYARAFEAADRGDWTAALGLAGQAHSATAHRLIEWRRLLDKNSGASFSELDSFLKANPDWPLHDTLFTRAETAIGPELSSAGIVAWFGGRPPVSSVGKIRLGEALIETGRTTEGKALVREGWRDGSFEEPQELAIVQKDGRYLTAEDERSRLDNLLWRDLIGDAKRELARVDERAARIAEARVALRAQPEQARRLLEKLSSAESRDPSLQFDHARQLRHAGSYRDAESLLLEIVSREAATSHPASWWGEFNAEARQALEDRDYHTAYRLAADSGLPAGDEFAEAQFLAGWVALRFLHEPSSALAHFNLLDAGVSRPVSKARAHYWLGRAHEAEGESAAAAREYEAASQDQQTFYGQLAAARVDPHAVLHVSETPVEALPHTEFEKEDLTQAMEVLADLGEENLLRSFAARDLELYPSAPHAKTLAEQLTAWGFREIALHVAKSESYDGAMMLDYTHPVIAIPAYHGPGAAPEPALVLGLIRQETEFDPDSVSGPGARGIMQLMPEAAEKAAREAGLPYRPNDLLSDPSYNMQLGMTELSGDLAELGGSYVLATAAYNAGRHNAEKWIAAFGDPRSPSTDPLDWIEAIPFTETRNYVERVLENTEIYRNRLAGRDQPLEILADLYRPNPAAAPSPDYEPLRESSEPIGTASVSLSQGQPTTGAVTLPARGASESGRKAKSGTGLRSRAGRRATRERGAAPRRSGRHSSHAKSGHASSSPLRHHARPPD